VVAMLIIRAETVLLCCFCPRIFFAKNKAIFNEISI
jgi:hypothetical protein